MGSDQYQSSCFTKLQVTSSEKMANDACSAQKRWQGTRRDAKDKSNDFAPKNRVARRWPAEGKHTKKKTRGRCRGCRTVKKTDAFSFCRSAGLGRLKFGHVDALGDVMIVAQKEPFLTDAGGGSAPNPGVKFVPPFSLPAEGEWRFDENCGKMRSSGSTKTRDAISLVFDVHRNWIVAPPAMTPSWSGGVAGELSGPDSEEKVFEAPCGCNKNTGSSISTEIPGLLDETPRSRSHDASIVSGVTHVFPR